MTKRKDAPRRTRRTRRTFTREVRREAVRLMVQRRQAGISLDQIARELDLSPDQLRTWGKALGVVTAVREERIGPTAGLSAEEELRRLRRELEVARQERDFLKKAVAFFAKSRGEVRLHCPEPRRVLGATHVPHVVGLARRLLRGAAPAAQRARHARSVVAAPCADGARAEQSNLWGAARAPGAAGPRRARREEARRAPDA